MPSDYGRNIATFIIAMLFGATLATWGMAWAVCGTGTGFLKYTGELTFGNVLQSLVTFASALIVTLFLQKIVNNHRKQKDLLLQHFEHLLSLLDEFEGMDNSEQLVEITKLLKKISLKNRLIAKCMEECGCRKKLRDQCDFGKQIRELRDLTTNTPRRRDLKQFSTQQNCPAYVKEGIMHWEAERVNEIDESIESLKAYIFRAQIHVNIS